MNETIKQGVGMNTYEIKINGKSTGWFGTLYGCQQTLLKLNKKSYDLVQVVEDNTGLGELDQNYLHNVNARHIEFTVAKRNKAYNGRGFYKNSYCKTIAPNNTGKKVYGFDGYVDVWTIKKVK